MKQNVVITFALFIFSQFMFWLLSQSPSIVTASEVFTITACVCFFLALYFAGFQWGRWVVTVILALLIFFLLSNVFDGRGITLLGVACLHVAVILMMFRYPPAVKVSAEKNIFDDPNV